MMLKYIRSIDIIPGDLIAFSIKTDEDKYSKVKYMIVDDTAEDEFDTGSQAIACYGTIFTQPSDNKSEVHRSEIRKQKLHIRDTPTILLLHREAIVEEKEIELPVDGK